MFGLDNLENLVTIMLSGILKTVLELFRRSVAKLSKVIIHEILINLIFGIIEQYICFKNKFT